MTTYDKKWNRQYEELVDFKRKNGHCMVPFKYEQDKSLGNWVGKQRNILVNNKMRSDRKELLDEIGFDWKADADHNLIQNDKLWHQQHEKLVEFKRKTGHCMVPRSHKENKSLGKWVNKQRNNHNNNKMRLDRKRILNEIGFAWNADGDHNFSHKDKIWHQHYEKLVEFKRKNGNCRVPQTNKKEASLGMWVKRQRSIHINEKMRLDRKELLDEVEFIWKADTGAARYFPTDVSGLIIGSFHVLGRPFF
jgi:uncharacterized protein YbgA (DUF1722 family)